MTEHEQTLRHHIMVINSEAAFLDAVRMLLEDEGHLVTTASYHSTDPFPVVLAAAPSLIILDFVHGEPHGWELLDKLERDDRTRGIPLLATSTDEALIEQIQELPTTARKQTCLIKPLDLDALLRTVNDLLDSD